MSNKVRRPARRQKPTGLQQALPGMLVLGGIVLIGLAVWAIWLRAAAPPVEVTVKGRPSLSVDKERIDFGDVPLGKWVQATFEVANVGDQPLRFREAPYIRVAAGC